MKQTLSNPAFDMKQINALNGHYQTMIDNGDLQCASYMMSRGGEVFATESLGGIYRRTKRKANISA